jgi:hypothetical protein
VFEITLALPRVLACFLSESVPDGRFRFGKLHCTVQAGRILGFFDSSEIQGQLKGEPLGADQMTKAAVAGTSKN